jgi:hypothetical protein
MEVEGLFLNKIMKKMSNLYKIWKIKMITKLKIEKILFIITTN